MTASNHIDTLLQMLKSNDMPEGSRAERERDARARVKRHAALQAAIDALTKPPSLSVREIVVRLGGTVNATRYHYVLHENGLATRYVDKPTAFESESATWKVEDDRLEIAFT